MSLKINEYGRSMTEMLGVLAVIGVLSSGALVGYSKAMYKYQMQKTVGFVSDAMLEYNLFLKKNFLGYPYEKDKMAENARNYGLLTECEPQNSSLAGGSYQVCKAPLGEIYPRFWVKKDVDGYKYNYMLYVTFLKNHRQACSDFLSRNWDKVVQEKLWRKGRLWIVSGTKDEVLYGGTTHKLDLTNIADACDDVCGGSGYCSVVFDFMGYKY